MAYLQENSASVLAAELNDSEDPIGLITPSLSQPSFRPKSHRRPLNHRLLVN